LTILLAGLIKKIEASPEEIQDETAKETSEDIEKEFIWRETVEQSQGKLGKLAEKALDDSKAERTKKVGFDELCSRG
jgi:hypothetical protein